MKRDLNKVRALFLLLSMQILTLLPLETLVFQEEGANRLVWILGFFGWKLRLMLFQLRAKFNSVRAANTAESCYDLTQDWVLHPSRCLLLLRRGLFLLEDNNLSSSWMGRLATTVSDALLGYPLELVLSRHIFFHKPLVQFMRVQFLRVKVNIGLRQICADNLSDQAEDL